MANTYTFIASISVGTATSSVTFSSIPQNYTDLIIRSTVRDTVAASVNSGIRLTFNGLSSNFSVTQLYDEVTSVQNYRDTSAGWIRIAYAPGSTATSNTFSSDEIYIPSYTLVQNKPVSGFSVTESNSASTSTSYRSVSAGLSTNTAAITSITLQSNSANIEANSSFYLYGIKNS